MPARKGTPAFKPSTVKAPRYGLYKKAANEYLDLEEKLHKSQREVKRLKSRCYDIANKMSRLSYHKLQLLGHQMVDRLRKERKEAKSQKDA